MASYAQAVQWIALNDSPADTPAEMDAEQAFSAVRNLLSVCLVADVWDVDQKQVAIDVLKARGIKVPRGFLKQLKA